ncbi:long-chain fatty acid--CoA ligase [Seohaeicola saemankumensis]|nr:long-chain fatty acid--CoA ligase [Seohaeicola saemankumensis]MCA0869979.1 long-chain fatty acid--CoA ligase [Seohaeicola saemankumensis]
MVESSSLIEAAFSQKLTIPEAFGNRVGLTPDSPAYLQFEEGAWRALTWRLVAERVDRRRFAFAHAGLRPGDRVAIFLPNCIDWIVTDLAAMSEGLVTVPVYTRDSAANICHVLRDSRTALCVTDRAERWNGLGPDADDLPDLKTIWSLTGGDSADLRLAPYPEPPDKELAVRRDRFGSPDDLATLIYTSGTTGPPKGVMLAHKSLLWNAAAVARVNPVTSDDRFLSILPLAHAFERTLGYVCPMLGNAQVAFARSVEDLAEDMQELSPTVMLAVPRLFERARAKALAKAGRSVVARKLLEWTEFAGWHRQQAAEGRRVARPVWERVFWLLLGQRVATRVRGAFGGRIRMMVCGGAPLSADTSRFMAAMEMPLLQGYGLTEAGPAVTGSTIDERRSDSVGFALPGSELAIGDRQELFVRSPGVMMGYWGKPAATREVLDDEGWLRTGDAAEVIEGRVYIRGRIKDILVLSTGENVNPTPIETALLADPLIDQACVLGEGRPWCSAVVVVNRKAFQHWSAEVGMADGNPNSGDLRQALVNRLEPRMDGIPPYARIRNFVVETSPWTLESGLITPTLKAKRPRIADRYGSALDALYE